MGSLLGAPIHRFLPMLVACTPVPEPVPDVPPAQDEDPVVDTELPAGPWRPTPQRPLSVAELRNTMRDVFGVDIDVGSHLPAELELGGLTHIDHLGRGSAEVFTRMAGLAAQLATDVIAETHQIVDAAPRVEFVASEAVWEGGMNAALGPFRDRILLLVGGGHTASSAFEIPADGLWQLQTFITASGSDFDTAEVWIDDVLALDWSTVPVSLGESPPMAHLTDHISLAAGTHTVELIAGPDGPGLPPWTPGGFYQQSGPWVALDRLVFTLGEDVVQTEPSPARAALLSCNPDLESRDGCVDQVLVPLARRAWRRPVLETEVVGLRALVEAATAEGADWAEAMSVGVEAIAAVPSFWFRPPIPEGATDADDHDLRPFGMATELSYSLWQSAPDDELLDCAAAGGLSAGSSPPCDLDSQITRMLADPRAHVVVDEMALRWLGVHRVPQLFFQVEIYPAYTPGMLDDMVDETRAMFSRYLDDELDLHGLFSDPVTRVTPRLARLYGVEETGAEEITLDLDRTHRLGVVTQPAVQAAISLGSEASPTRRAAWVVTDLLCRTLPPPPPNVPMLPPTEADDDLQAIADQHLSDPACAACHASFDPYGTPLITFDAIGAVRRGVVPSTLPDGTPVTYPADLGRWLSTQDEPALCLSEFVLGWTLGRQVTDADADLLTRVHASALSEGFHLRALLAATLTEPAAP